MDGKSGNFPRQANGPMYSDSENKFQITPLAVGNEIVFAPNKNLKKIKISSEKNKY